MRNKPWFQTRIRWAVMEEGHGIYQWRESEYIFLSENRETALQEALRIGRKEEHALVRDDGGPDIECRLPRLFTWKNREQRQRRSRSSWERRRRPTASATTTCSDPRSGCRRPCSDRALSLARPSLRPKRSAYGLAGLRSGRASESVKPGGGPNESIEVGQIELTNTALCPGPGGYRPGAIPRLSLLCADELRLSVALSDSAQSAR